MSWFDDNEDWIMGWNVMDEPYPEPDPEAAKEQWIAQQRGTPEDDFDAVAS